ncbi:MAG: hypothetical protein HY870_16110 [Chloroflexi bacterium]|nr:hypothetical protein [Chloroflexota bacterium]
MQLPDPLPTEPDALEELYRTYCQQEDADEAELQRLTEARLSAWGIDPQHMTADQVFNAMNESMNSMLMNLYAAQDEAPDDELATQMKELIGMAEQLREHISEAMNDEKTKNDK